MTLAQFAVTPFDNPYKYATKAVDSFTKQDIDEAMPYDYISKIVVITNGEVEHTAKFISAKFAEVYGSGVTFDFRFSELSGNTAMVMVHQGKADRFNSKQLNDRINEIEKAIGEWL